MKSGQADRPDGEVVVLREHLDEDRSCRLELVLLRQRVERLARPWHDLLAHHGRFVGVQAHDQIAVADRLELVDRIQHGELVEDEDVVRDRP